MIQRATAMPAGIIGRADDPGHLGVGTAGDVAVLAHEKGTFEFTDSENQILTGNQRLVCRATIKGGKIWWKG